MCVYIRLLIVLSALLSACFTQALLYRRQVAPQYLNTERPLWILEDQVRRHDELQVYSTTALPPPTPTNALLQQLTRTRALSPPMTPTALTLYVRERTAGTRRRPPPTTSTYPLRLPYKHMRRPMSTAMPRHIRLPTQYVNNNSHNSNNKNNNSNVRVWQRRAHMAGTRNLIASMPIFDSVPGEDNERPQTVFLYNGPKGELIMNTMLSTQRYPMHEPVPGQVLFPPLTPMFRPKPIVQRYRQTTPGRQLLNLTLIPFYAHEAINAPNLQKHTTATHDDDDDGVEDDNVATVMPMTTNTPTVVYETQLTPAKSTRLSPRKRHRHRQHSHSQQQRRKRPKQYTAYHSPDEVQWQPPAVDLLQFKRANTTPMTPTMSSHDNHRLYTATAYDSIDAEADDDDVEAQANNFLAKYETEMETSTLVNNNLRPTHEVDFPIIYFNESIELPQTVDNFVNDDVDDDDDDDDVEDEEDAQHVNVNDVVEAYPETSTDRTYEQANAPIESRHSSRYALTKEYYAFPVYTLGKLLHSTTETSLPTTTHFKSTQTNRTPSTASNVNTWFILNSRYKGPYKDHNGQYKKQHKEYYTSKYIANNVGSEPLASTITTATTKA